MDIGLMLKALFLGIIEGLTEFLPISSTGHLIIFSDLLGFKTQISALFTVAIQLGAVLAVVWYFRSDLSTRCKYLFARHDPRQRKLAWRLLLAFLPAALVGAAFSNSIEILLGQSLWVGFAQILGGSLLLWIESHSRKRTRMVHDLDHISKRQALGVGFWQILSLWPGMSRAGSTITGGLFLGLDRSTATQFSFYLAIPVMFGATTFMLIKKHELLQNQENILLLTTGFLFAFFSGWFVIKFVMFYVKNHTYKPFAYYRIFLGILILFAVSMDWLS